MKNTYPIYLKSNICHWFKITDEQSAVSVCNGQHSNQFEISIITPMYLLKEPYVTISEAEFLEAFFEVRNKLNKLCLIQIDK